MVYFPGIRPLVTRPKLPQNVACRTGCPLRQPSLASGRTTISEPSLSWDQLAWDQLIELIEDRKVVPVVGQDLLTVPESSGSKRLYPWIANRLAAYLKISADDLPEGNELNEVACRYISKGKPSQQIYIALKKMADDADSLPVPEPLLQLASIPFPVFVSTTFDSMLVRAVNQKHFGGNAGTQVLAYSPNELQDTPNDAFTSATPTVYQLMGKLSAAPAYAVTQEDYIEFFHALQSDTHRPAQLFQELGNRNLLMLGTHLSGSLTSFLMRMSRRQRLSQEDKTDYVADDCVSHDQDLVLFLERFSSGTEIFREADPVAFVAELYRRWTEAHPPSKPASAPPGDSAAQPCQAEPGCVFLSYSHQDRPAALKLKDALQAEGVDVFYDGEQLQAGDNWDSKLERYIHQCSYFIPVISNNTVTDQRQYVFKEWNLALEEALRASSQAVFLLPVIIDNTPIDHPVLDPKFRTRQVTSLPDGNPTPGWLQTVKQLYRNYLKAKTAGAA
jgi:hypothetical protein